MNEDCPRTGIYSLLSVNNRFKTIMNEIYYVYVKDLRTLSKDEITLTLPTI
jgi:hypothetical protein